MLSQYFTRKAMEKNSTKAEITREHLGYMVVQKKKLIESLSSLLESERKELEKLEGLLKGKALLPPVKAGDLPEFNPSWSWTQKIIFAVKSQDKPLLSSEIIATLSRVHPGIFTGYDAANTVSVYLSQAVKNERLIKYKVKGQKGYFYGHPSWFTDTNELKTEYKNKLSLL